MSEAKYKIVDGDGAQDPADQIKRLREALFLCRRALDEIWFDKDTREEHRLWIEDQQEAIRVADLALQRPINPTPRTPQDYYEEKRKDAERANDALRDARARGDIKAIAKYTRLLELARYVGD